MTNFLSLELSLKKVCAGQCKSWLWDGRKSNNNSDKVKTRTKGQQKSSGTCVGEGASRVLEEWTLFPIPWVTPAPARRAGKGAACSLAEPCRLAVGTRRAWSLRPAQRRAFCKRSEVVGVGSVPACTPLGGEDV